MMLYILLWFWGFAGGLALAKGEDLPAGILLIASGLLLMWAMIQEQQHNDTTH
jgi:hypothetical protein